VIWPAGAESAHPTSQKRDAPNFLYAALDRSACAPFIKEIQGTHETPQEIGDVGHPSTVAVKAKSALQVVCPGCPATSTRLALQENNSCELKL
jgi:hypothetical protein